MTSAERAKELLVYMASLPDTPDVDTTLAVFAAAITQAQNDKLEEAARACETFFNGFATAASRIRSLKSKDTP